MVDIANDDIVARSLFDPKDIRLADLPEPALLPLNERNLTFESKNNNEESVNCLRLLEGCDNVEGETAIDKCHQLGFDKADTDNIGIRVANVTSDKPRPERTYVGYVQTRVERIRAASDATIAFDVHHEPIEGNAAHCNIKMSVSGEVAKRVKNGKIAYITSLFDQQILA